MSKGQYIFNPESVSFERVERNYKARILKGLLFFAVASTMGFVLLLGLSFIMGTPKEKTLSNENAQLKVQYMLMDKKLNNLVSVLENMQNRDDNIYRVLFNINPVPGEVRQSGIGGINRYEHLDNLSNKEIVKGTAQKLDQLMKQAYVQSQSFDELEEMATNMQEMLASVPAILPIKKEFILTTPSGWGMRMHPIYKIRKFHHGMDFAAPTGTEIYASGDGVVTKSNRGSGYGTHVVIKHNYGGYETLYAHMIRSAVRIGQKVKRGDVIGYVGSTGQSTAPHLHYEVHRNGERLNPANFYFNDLSPKEYEEMLQASSQPVQSFD